jgi:hypothetical protein
MTTLHLRNQSVARLSCWSTHKINRFASAISSPKSPFSLPTMFSSVKLGHYQMVLTHSLPALRSVPTSYGRNPQMADTSTFGRRLCVSLLILFLAGISTAASENSRRARAFRSQCPTHRKRESQQDVSGCKTLRNDCVYSALWRRSFRKVQMPAKTGNATDC